MSGSFELTNGSPGFRIFTGFSLTFGVTLVSMIVAWPVMNQPPLPSVELVPPGPTTPTFALLLMFTVTPLSILNAALLVDSAIMLHDMFRLMLVPLISSAAFWLGSRAKMQPPMLPCAPVLPLAPVAELLLLSLPVFAT